MIKQLKDLSWELLWMDCDEPNHNVIEQEEDLKSRRERYDRLKDDMVFYAEDVEEFLVGLAREHHQKAKELFVFLKDDPYLEEKDNIGKFEWFYRAEGARDALLKAAGKPTTYFEDEKEGVQHK